MPLENYWLLEAAVDLRTKAHVRFAMRDGDTLVPCRVSFAALRGLVDGVGVLFDPLAVFHGHSAAVEDAASEQYDREGLRGGWVDLDEADFD